MQRRTVSSPSPTYMLDKIIAVISISNFEDVQVAYFIWVIHPSVSLSVHPSVHAYMLQIVMLFNVCKIYGFRTYIWNIWIHRKKASILIPRHTVRGSTVIVTLCIHLFVRHPFRQLLRQSFEFSICCH